MHNIIGDIIEWDVAQKTYLVGEGQSSERYIQRLEAAGLMAEIEARWQHLPGGFHGERKRIKIHIQAVADSTQVISREELCWLAIAAASTWLTKPATALSAPKPEAATTSISGMPGTRTSPFPELEDPARPS